MIKLKMEGSAVLMGVKVVPGASRTRYLGEWDGRARIAVAAPPERGKANQAMLRFLAQTLKLPGKSVHLITGHDQPLKLIRIEGASMKEILDRLQK